MFFPDGLRDLARPLGVVVMLLSLASGSAAAIYVWRRGPKEPTPDDLRIMSATTFGLIRHLSPL